MSIYIKFEGGKPPIRGGATKGKHIGWLELDSLSVSTSRSLGVSGSNGVTRTVGSGMASEVTGGTSVAGAMRDLFDACAQGTSYTTVTIEFWKDGVDGPVLTYNLQDVFVTSVQFSSGGHVPSTMFSLSYAKVSYNIPGPPEGKSASLMQFDIDRALA